MTPNPSASWLRSTLRVRMTPSAWSRFTRLVMGHVAGDDVEAQVDPAEEGLDLGDFRHGAGAAEEFVEGAGVCLVEGETQRDFHLEAEGGPVDDCVLAPDDAFAGHPLDAARAGGGGHAGARGEIGRGEGRVGLKAAENPSVGVIDLHVMPVFWGL